MTSRPLLLAVCTLVLACAHPAPKNVEDQREDVAHMRGLQRAQRFTWAAWGPEAFERARATGRPLLVHGAAEWCHWCHVMEETTYRDPAVGAVLAAQFIPVRVDIDARPDFAERYSAWGWPATIILSPSGTQLAAYRGYLPPERLLELLSKVHATTSSTLPMDAEPPVPPAVFPWIASWLLRDLDAYFDAEEGGWGTRQKMWIGPNLEVEVARAAAGDVQARRRLQQTLEAQRALMDPVWGGIYQYSTGGEWTQPHFEKLMSVQGPSLEALAAVQRAFPSDHTLEDGNRVASYLTGFLATPQGVFRPSQDADVGAHDRGVAFMDGHQFYALDDAGRRRVPAPWVDPHVYARENGMAICGLAAWSRAASSPVALEAATVAAQAILASHVRLDGTVVHAAEDDGVPVYLADAAWLGRGLLMLGDVTGDPAWLAHALRIGQALERNFWNAQTQDLQDATPDADATGAFNLATHSVSQTAVAARFLAQLGHATGDARWAQLASRALAAVMTPSQLDAQGRFLGDTLMALMDLRVWPVRATEQESTGNVIYP